MEEQNLNPLLVKVAAVAFTLWAGAVVYGTKRSMDAADYMTQATLSIQTSQVRIEAEHKAILMRLDAMNQKASIALDVASQHGNELNGITERIRRLESKH